jgi:DNA repair exonuclease SbcCD nuclease subunit
MVRILHTADLHRGAPSAHPVYNTRTLPELVNLAIRKRCQYVLVVGDIFDKPKPDQTVKDFLVRQLLDTKDQIDFVFVPGNHDYTTKALEYHSLNYLHYLREASNYKVHIQVVEPGTFISLRGINVFAMQEWGDIELARKENTGKKPLVIAWHGTVPGLQFSNITHVPKGTVKSIKKILSKANAQYIALGDIHRPIKLHPRCWYPGPPVQKAYSDKDGVLLVALNLEKIKVKKYRLPLPKKITLDVTFEEGVDSEETMIEFIKDNIPANNFLKLKFELPLKVWGSLNQKYVKSALEDHCLEIKLENDPIPDVRARKSIEKVSKAKSLQQEIDIVLDEEDFGLNKKKLRAVCRNYL